MSKNSNLHKASVAKEDEFYTQFPDIEKELWYYKGQFKNRVVFCNCDDPYESNFFKYFALNFNHLGLKKLIATCYIGSSIANTQLSLFDNEPVENKTTKSPHKIEITNVTGENPDSAINLTIVENLLRDRQNVLTRLKGDGDFRSPECVELLKEVDIVVTNPPFSMFREYVAQLIDFEKKFIIIGNQNAITYKDIFSLFKENKIWLGYRSGDMEFIVPDHYQPRPTRYREENGVKYRSMGNICWYTNIDIPKRHEKIELYGTYSNGKYPRYDNYDAIEVSKVSDIPVDWDGAMGVPITFLDKYNPEQFHIIGIDRYVEGNKTPNRRMQIKGKEVYARVIIKKKGLDK